MEIAMNDREPLSEVQTKLCAVAVSINPLAIIPGDDEEVEVLDGLVERGNLETVVRTANGETHMGRDRDGEVIGYVASRELMRAMAEGAARN
jgi:hypothetical protein